MHLHGSAVCFSAAIHAGHDDGCDGHRSHAQGRVEQSSVGLANKKRGAEPASVADIRRPPHFARTSIKSLGRNRTSAAGCATTRATTTTRSATLAANGGHIKCVLASSTCARRDSHAHAHKHKYKHRCMHTHEQTHIKTNKHACIHTEIHTCIHTHMAPLIIDAFLLFLLGGLRFL